MQANQENIYWLFSASAQTISAFVAFLVTGFAVILNMLDGLQAKDDTLEDIHTKLKNGYYKKIRLLLIVTGFAIILSLWMVFLNGGNSSHKCWLFILTAIVNFAAIFIGILFVVLIINPGRYTNAAKEIIKEDKLEDVTKSNTIDQLTFMTDFIKLEKRVRDKLVSKDLYISFGNTPKMAYSFRQMINALFQNELINRKELDELLKINKYRNLVFHGHQDKVDKGMLDRVNAAKNILDKIS